MPQRNEKDRRPMSLRRTVLVWTVGAVIGWAVAIVGIYYLLKTGDTLIADFLGRGGNEQKAISDEAEGLSKIAPAAGPEKPAEKPAP